MIISINNFYLYFKVRRLTFMKKYIILLILILCTAPVFTQPFSPNRKVHEIEKARYDRLQSFELKAPTPDQKLFDVLSYQLDLDLFPDKKILSGSVTVDGRSLTDNLQYIEIDLYHNLSVDSIIYSDSRLNFTHSNNLIRITLPSAMSLDQEFSIQIYYQGNPQESVYRSFGWSTHGNDIPIIWTLSEPYGSPAWWPCKDDPKDKADQVNLNITVPSDLIVASNGILTGVSGSGGRSTYHWETTYPISTYLVSLAISNYEQYSDWYAYSPGDSMEVAFYVYPEHLERAREDLSVTVDMLEFYSSIFGEYPFIREKYGMAIFPWGGGMEHQTITSYGAGLIQGNHRYDYINAHELAHQWFGDAITMRFWSHIWLNEGFASYAEALWFEHLYGKEVYHQYIDAFDNHPLEGPLFVADSLNEGALFSRTVYDKGAFTLHMLRGVLGDTTFFRCLKHYAQKSRFVYGTATTEDFQKLCEESSGMELGWFFLQWVYRGDRPEYSAQWSVAGNGPYTTTLNITQQNSNLFKMPIQIKLGNSAGDTVFTIWNEDVFHQYTFITNEESHSLTIDPENWVLKTVSVNKIEGDLRDIPLTFEVEQNFPNPFNPETSIPFTLPENATVNLEIFNVIGEKIYTESKEFTAGYHTIIWNGVSNQGNRVPTGVYFYRVSTPSATQTRRMVLVR